MLSDHARETLREIQRQFLIEDLGFARSFHSVEQPPPPDRCWRPHTRAIILGVRLSVLLLAGPRILTEAEVTDRKKPPGPRTSSPSPHRVSFDYMTGLDWVPAPETLALVSPAGTGTSRVLGPWVSPPSPPDSGCGTSPPPSWWKPSATA